jgi:hypothetical protein
MLKRDILFFFSISLSNFILSSYKCQKDVIAFFLESLALTCSEDGGISFNGDFYINPLKLHPPLTNKEYYFF